MPVLSLYSHGITGNAVALSGFRWALIGIWRKWLSRRRRRGTLAWDQFTRLLERYPLPPPIVVHSVYRSVANS
jgi:RNA-directed DNA polymerase